MSPLIMRKKIGLFLFSDPYGGGAFQYSQSILHAALAFPKMNMKLLLPALKMHGSLNYRQIQ